MVDCNLKVNWVFLLRVSESLQKHVLQKKDEFSVRKFARFSLAYKCYMYMFIIGKKMAKKAEQMVCFA